MRVRRARAPVPALLLHSQHCHADRGLVSAPQAASRRWAARRSPLRPASMLQHPPIVLAAAKGDLATVRRLLEEGVPVDSCGSWTESEDKGAYEKSWDWNSDTALCAAVRGGHTELVRVLLSAGASPTFRVCNACDHHETPRGIAKAVQAAHPACAQLLLSDAFEELRAKAEAAWAATIGTPATLFELAARELRIAKACELVGELPLSAMHTLDLLFTACAPSTLARVPEMLRERVTSAWRSMEKRTIAQKAASEACLALGHLYLRGEGVTVDEAAAFHWLLRGLRSRPAEHVAYCWGNHADHAKRGYGDGKCYHCDVYTNASNTLATLATNPAAGGAAAVDALAAEAQRSAALLDTPLHALEMLRQDMKEKLEAEHQAELVVKRAAATVLQREQDERFAVVRQREVARCAQFEAQRLASIGGGVCTRRHCDDKDSCTYWHTNDLPPQCRWFQLGKCTNGERCWFNHLPAKPARVPWPW